MGCGGAVDAEFMGMDGRWKVILECEVDGDRATGSKVDDFMGDEDEPGFKGARA